jgi:hypothetical protein
VGERGRLKSLCHPERAKAKRGDPGHKRVSVPKAPTALLYLGCHGRGFHNARAFVETTLSQ